MTIFVSSLYEICGPVKSKSFLQLAITRKTKSCYLKKSWITLQKSTGSSVNQGAP